MSAKCMFHQRWQTSTKFRFFIFPPNLWILIKCVNLLLRKMMLKEMSKLRWLYNILPIKWTQINVLASSQLISPSGKKLLLQPEQMDPDRLCVRVVPSEIGSHKIHIRFNAVEIPQSPLKFEVCEQSYQTSQCSMFLTLLLNPWEMKHFLPI